MRLSAEIALRIVPKPDFGSEIRLKMLHFQTNFIKPHPSCVPGLDPVRDIIMDQRKK